MAIDTSAFRQQGRLTGRGPAPAGNRAAPRKGVGIVRSAFRHYGKSTGQGSGARSKRDGAGNGKGIKTSAFRQSDAAWSIGSWATHNHQVVRSIRTAATNRVTPSLVTERVCKTCAYAHAGFDSPATHHATVAQRQSFTSPT